MSNKVGSRILLLEVTNGGAPFIFNGIEGIIILNNFDGITGSIVGVDTAYDIGIEILFDMQKRGQLELRWSIILAVAAISAVGIYEAVSYAVRINKK